jgi:tryptophanyl-tRNA synthetase
VTAGLFMYPVLMAADILLFRAHQIPVGRDQVQHIEMARDIAQSFNHLYGEHFVLPAAAVDESVALLPGLDGRKMSKSYDNVIGLFSPRDQVRKQIFSIVTDSRAPGEPKEVEGSALFQVYQAFASAEETQKLRQAYAEGISWADAKQVLFERIDREIAPMRERYEHLVSHPGELEDILQAGAAKARTRATPLMRELRQAVGLRNLGSSAAAGKKDKSRTALPSFKQYREADGRFYFKFVDAQGKLLVQSAGFASPKEAGQCIAAMKQSQALPVAAEASIADGVDPSVVSAALKTLAESGN